MATDQRTHNQPSHEAQVKGGQHSHSGKHNEDSQANMQSGDTQSGNRTPPSREEASKGGQHSHSGSQRDEQDSGSGGNRTPPSREEASKGGQHSHSGGRNS